MSQYQFDGLPPKVVAYIKIHLRSMYSTGLFRSQEREDLIQELVLFYFEFIRQRGHVPDNILFMAFKSKAMHLGRTRLREMQSGSLISESLNDMSDNEGYEPSSNFTLGDLENAITLKEIKAMLSEKQNKFIDLLCEGWTAEEARAELHISHTVLNDIREIVLRGKRKMQKK